MKPWCAEDFMVELLARSGIATASREPPPAKAANPANREHPCARAVDSVICEGLRKLRNDAGAGDEDAGRFAEFAELRKSENQPQSKQPCGVSQDSQDSQGVSSADAIATVGDGHHRVDAGCTCAAFIGKTPAPTQDRPHKLTFEQLHAAHAEPWSEAAIAGFQARTAVIQRHGYGEQDAEDLAEQLHLRDVHANYRHLCVECSHYRPGRCGNHGAAGLMAPELARAMTVMFQDCPGFQATR